MQEGIDIDADVDVDIHGDIPYNLPPPNVSWSSPSKPGAFEAEPRGAVACSGPPDRSSELDYAGLCMAFRVA